MSHAASHRPRSFAARMVHVVRSAISYAVWPIARSNHGHVYDLYVERTSMRVVQTISYWIAIERSTSRTIEAASGGASTAAYIMIENSTWCKCGRCRASVVLWITISPAKMRGPGIDSHQHRKDSWQIWRHLRKDILLSCKLRCRLIFLHGCSRTYRVACVLVRWAVFRITCTLIVNTCDIKRIYFCLLVWPPLLSLFSLIFIILHRSHLGIYFPHALIVERRRANDLPSPEHVPLPGH